MKSLLTEQDIIYLLEQQERLDADIRETHKIPKGVWLNAMDDEHEIALRVEVAEFVIACYKSWKYWKTKPMSREDIIDEAVDVLHFIMLDWNKLDSVDIESILERFNDVNVAENQSEVKSMIHIILIAENALDIFIYLIAVLDFYDFDRKHIMEAYDKKNKVNFERLESGTY